MIRQRLCTVCSVSREPTLNANTGSAPANSAIEYRVETVIAGSPHNPIRTPYMGAGNETDKLWHDLYQCTKPVKYCREICLIVKSWCFCGKQTGSRQAVTTNCIDQRPSRPVRVYFRSISQTSLSGRHREGQSLCYC